MLAKIVNVDFKFDFSTKSASRCVVGDSIYYNTDTPTKFQTSKYLASFDSLVSIV